MPQHPAALTNLSPKRVPSMDLDFCLEGIKDDAQRTNFGLQTLKSPLVVSLNVVHYDALTLGYRAPCNGSQA